MFENFNDFEDNDFGDLCRLADIFPDIEPYLEDVTNSYEKAKTDIDKKIEKHIDGSDSDSGISADSYANGIFKNLDSSIHIKNSYDNKISKPVKVTTSYIPENKTISKTLTDNKIFIKKPISFLNKIGTDTKQPIYNIIPKISNYQYQKPLVIKSHSISSKVSDNIEKDIVKPISKITPIKLLKNNNGLPVMVNNEKISFDVSSSTSKNGKRSYIPNETDIKIEMDSPFELFSSLSSNDDNIFFKKDLVNIHENISLLSNFNDVDIHKDHASSCVSVSSSDILQKNDNKAYIEIFNSNNSIVNKVLQTSSYNNSNCDGILDSQHYDRMVKKQERMIKNRQAASLSRQRKKEYVERLEHKVEQQKQENNYLQSQINDIRERFCALEQENHVLKKDIQTWRERYYDLERQKMKHGMITSNKTIVRSLDMNNKSKALKATAASTTILGLIIILTFNFNLPSIYNSQNGKDVTTYKQNYQNPNTFLGNKILGSESRLSRTLFSIIENSSFANSENLGNNICNQTNGLNISETLRLTRELNRWGLRFKTESVKIYDRLQNEKIKSQILNKEMESMIKKTKLRDAPIMMNKKKRDSESGQLEIYPRNNYYGFFDNFINDIDRKPDTLYFVTFHSDNLIFPASNMNKNLSTPKITLFLPADINQADKNFYKMMKIDCQVQNFTIVNLKKIKLP